MTTSDLPGVGSRPLSTPSGSAHDYLKLDRQSHWKAWSCVKIVTYGMCSDWGCLCRICILGHCFEVYNPREVDNRLRNNSGFKLNWVPHVKGSSVSFTPEIMIKSTLTLITGRFIDGEVTNKYPYANSNDSNNKHEYNMVPITAARFRFRSRRNRKTIICHVALY